MAVKKKPTPKAKAGAKKATVSKGSVAAAKKPVAKKAGGAKSAEKKASAGVSKPARGRAGAKADAARSARPGSVHLSAAGSGNGSGNGTSAGAKSARRKGTHLTAKEIKQFHQLLLNLRDQVVDEISFLAGDNLSGKTLSRTGEEGTDNFNREFALKLVSNEQDIIYEIDEAIQRIHDGTYGICEHSGEPIEKERLKILPHARHCVRVQSELERGRARYRPFGPSIDRA
jgi:RNA polymerase-binding transcription factor DksA